MSIGSRRCLVNPHSGTADHIEYVERAMEARGFEVIETESAEHTVELGEEAGEDGVSVLAVCGGDGTINDALRGLWRADAFGEVILAVLPAGTANLLASTLGIDSLDDGIELSDTGETRAVDVGLAKGSDDDEDRARDTAVGDSVPGDTTPRDTAPGDTAGDDDAGEEHVAGETPADVREEGSEPFLVSCIAGLPAETSTSTSDELKERFGMLAFLARGAGDAVAFDGLDVRIESPERTWEGEALTVLVGNARKFVEEGGQADMEDGEFDVVVAEQMPAPGIAVEAALHRLLGEGTESVTHFHAEELHLESDGEPITFSRDGEVATYQRLDFRCLHRALHVRVGEGYAPQPE